MYRVISGFADLEDNKHWYECGAVYPRKGKKASPDRIAVLLSSRNKAGKPVIKEEPEEETPVVVRKRKSNTKK